MEGFNQYESLFSATSVKLGRTLCLLFKHQQNSTRNWWMTSHVKNTAVNVYHVSQSSSTTCNAANTHTHTHVAQTWCKRFPNYTRSPCKDANSQRAMWRHDICAMRVFARVRFFEREQEISMTLYCESLALRSGWDSPDVTDVEDKHEWMQRTACLRRRSDILLRCVWAKRSE